MTWRPLAALACGLVLVGVGIYILLTRDDPEWVVQTSWVREQPTGAVRFCGGEDISRSQRRSEHDYNVRFAKSRATFSEAAFDADAQHDLYVETVKEGSDECDVIVLDVIYMKEFAAKHLLYDMTPYLEQHDRGARFDDRMMKSAEHDGKQWGVPKQIDVGVMYYRDDRVSRPTSWQSVYDESRSRGPGDPPGLRVQVGAYEGLTVIFLELAHAAGAGPIVSDDGRTAQLDQDGVVDALAYMRDGMRDRAIPRRQQKDLSNLAVYELGRAKFLRGWPFVNDLLHEDADKGDSALARQTRRATDANTSIAPLPPWKEGGKRSFGVLGGHNLVIPRSAHNAPAALRLIDFLTSEGQVRKDVVQDSQYPVRKRLAAESGVGDPELIEAIEATTVIPRPPLTRYADVSTIISCRVREIILGDSPGSLRASLRDMNDEVQRVLDGGASKLERPDCTRRLVLIGVLWRRAAGERVVAAAVKGASAARNRPPVG